MTGVDEPTGHIPVLPAAVKELLAVRAGETVVDATIGDAGHAVGFAEAIGPTGTLIGLDADPASLSAAEAALRDVVCTVKLVHENFANIAAVLNGFGLSDVDVLFADLGVSSRQLSAAERGFSFQSDGPLDMRMDPRLTVTAADLVNRLKERELADLLYHNAQEFSARRIAKRVCEHRRDRRITTTGRLAEIVAGAARVNPASRRSRLHPATKTFLALRMAVNNEIGSLDALLSSAPGVLKPGGRVGIIAFHSEEDRPVKVDFRRRKQAKEYRVLTPKPVIADADERARNPRARSAKLRVAVRLSAE